MVAAALDHRRSEPPHVVGSLIGHWAAGALGLAAAGTLANWIVSLVGVLIAILRALGVLR